MDAAAERETGVMVDVRGVDVDVDVPAPDVDDLFGDSASDGASDGDGDGIDVDGDEEEVDNDNEEPEPEPEYTPSVLDVTLERHPRSHTPAHGTSYSFPLPRFLFVDPEPFTPNVFESKVREFIENTIGAGEEDDQSVKSSLEFKKLQLLNTVRWRYAKQRANGALYKQSNAKIIEWEDGSLSLRLGNEMFDVRSKPNDDNVLAFRTADTLMALSPLNRSIQVLPPSMKSKAHKILASTLTKNMKQKRSKRINTIVTHEDPELKAREISRVQREIEKARRRQEQKLIQQQEEEDAASSRAGSRLGAVSGDIDVDDVDDDDDDDIDVDGGFVVDDDEDAGSAAEDDELDRAAERLKQVKRAGAARYAEEEEDDDDDAVVRRKRRAVLAADEDDE